MTQVRYSFYIPSAIVAIFAIIHGLNKKNGDKDWFFVAAGILILSILFFRFNAERKKAKLNN